jgi:hypothetical protein
MTSNIYSSALFRSVRFSSLCFLFFCFLVVSFVFLPKRQSHHFKIGSSLPSSAYVPHRHPFSTKSVPYALSFKSRFEFFQLYMVSSVIHLLRHATPTSPPTSLLHRSRLVTGLSNTNQSLLGKKKKI